MKTKIIVDSTIDLLPEIKQKVSVVPLTLHFGKDEYIDGVTINHKEFYEKLVESDVMPSTSQATPDSFAKQFKKTKQNDEGTVVITLASSLSGTYQSAVIAAQSYKNLYIVDSSTVAIGGGILTELAVKYSEEGLSAKEIADKLNTDKERIVIVALVDTLEYLKKGGRISKTAFFAGSVLNIKPVLSFTGGRINILGKARGSKMGNNLLVQEIEKAGGVDFSMPILLGYTGLSDALLKKYIQDSKHLFENNQDKIRYTTIGSVIGTHVGPGAVAVAFFKK